MVKIFIPNCLHSGAVAVVVVVVPGVVVVTGVVVVARATLQLV